MGEEVEHLDLVIYAIGWPWLIFKYLNVSDKTTSICAFINWIIGIAFLIIK